MSGTKRNYSPRRAGEVVGVEVDAHAERPVTITCHDHVHTYEIAWRNTADGPVITDLRVTSVDGVPITSATLRRVNTARLARTAALHDTGESANAATKLRQTLDTATGTTEGHDWIERFRFTDGVIDAMAKHAPPGAAPTRSSANRVGRPSLSPEFLAQVAVWAREESVLGGGVYRRVADRAADALGRDVSDDTVKGWIKRCKHAGLLKPDELRRQREPLVPTTTDQETDR
ncbi:hypothetical protein [Mycobacterium asiaticum]|uniref:Uncharacterized protein n=1 Tax=Mycobacterium asiaticum TaxID=1790 RepID=A0A1A3MW73_MYCAS|nr:hypothetical protein [Mycobacterium asiaticum]OBK13320.1 hypothetical protein A5636_09485 [Mycobacterium asiaticum]